MFELDLLEQAEVELSESYNWYEDQQAGLGNRFYKEVNHYLGLIESDPYKYPVRYEEEIRTAALKMFPFIIIYWIDEPKHIIQIISFSHQQKSAKY